MKTLAAQIERELQVPGVNHYAVYDDELQQVWPLDTKDRKAKIGQFAKEYGFRLAYYKEGLCALFQKDSTSN